MKQISHLPWAHHASIYCINLRQFTEQGTFKAAALQLDRIKALGVKIIWLLPIHPIGVIERKGTLGSYYAASDYKAVNPEFGTLADCQDFVAQCHQRGLKVIIDWVANHTGWDHVWVKQHHDWFKHDENGQIFPVTFRAGDHVEYWTDVVALDYDQPALWDGMIDAMKFWVTETQIDGFRCDVAGMVPMPFWQRARRELDAVKPMFILAEWHTPQMHDQAFDMSYDMQLFNLLKQIAQGKAGIPELKAWWQMTTNEFPADAYRMIYTANHDTNSWQGSDQELFGESCYAMAVLAALLPGMPLIYGGQESFFTKRLAFFEKDPIVWGQYERSDFYRDLIALKTTHPALVNGSQGANLQFVDTGNPEVLQFTRTRISSGQPDAWVKVTVNLSAHSQSRSGTVPLAPWAWQIETSAV